MQSLVVLIGTLRYQSFIREAEVVAVTNNDVIQYFYAHEFSCGGKFLCELFIFRAGCNVGAGMIVDTNNCRREFLQGCMNDFPHDRHGMIDRARGSIVDFDDAVVAVEIDNFKYFGLEVAHLRHDDIDNILCGSDLLLDTEHFVFTETSPDFQGCFDLRDFGRAQAFEFFPFAHIGMAHVAERTKFIQYLARQINGTVAFDAGAQEYR